MPPLSQAQAPAPPALVIAGSVADRAGAPVAGAHLTLEVSHAVGAPELLEAQSTARGEFRFSVHGAGDYALAASKSAVGVARVRGSLVENVASSPVKLVLAPASPSAAAAMEFSDSPAFTVAGVTDWTAVGGHGSDATLRTSEDLARAAVTLKPSSPANLQAEDSRIEQALRAAWTASPGSYAANHSLGQYYLRAGRFRDAEPLLKAASAAGGGKAEDEFELAQTCRALGDLVKAQQHIQAALAKQDAPEFHRFAGELDEQRGDSLGAVRQLERAARLDPSEANTFAWGSELLLHRAVWQAAEVFSAGVEAHPESLRMRTARGAALFSAARYDEAAEQLCDVSAMRPEEPEPYRLLGQIEMAAPKPLPCVDDALARFAGTHAKDPAANYLYAMSLLKQTDRDRGEQAEALLLRAASVNPHYAPALLELGILSSTNHQPSRAIDFYQRALEADPQLAEAHYRLGVAYDRAGQPEKAREQFRLHAALEKAEADRVERQRREVKQFIVMVEGEPKS